MFGGVVKEILSGLPELHLFIGETDGKLPVSVWRDCSVAALGEQQVHAADLEQEVELIQARDAFAVEVFFLRGLLRWDEEQHLTVDGVRQVRVQRGVCEGAVRVQIGIAI